MSNISVSVGAGSGWSDVSLRCHEEGRQSGSTRCSWCFPHTPVPPTRLWSALTDDQVAQQLSDTAGREITYLGVPPHAAAQGMIMNGIPEAAVYQVMEIFAGLRRGEYATTDDVAPSLTGRPSVTLAELARGNAAVLGDLAVR